MELATCKIKEEANDFEALRIERDHSDLEDLHVRLEPQADKDTLIEDDGESRSKAEENTHFHINVGPNVNSPLFLCLFLPRLFRGES